MRVCEPADKMLLTAEPLLSASKTRPYIMHTITLLDPAAGQSCTVEKTAAWTLYKHKPTDVAARQV